MRPARLLRWYPKAWREQYGEELLALIQDTADEGQPTWRLRLGVIRGGLSERGHQARRVAQAAVKRVTGPSQSPPIFLAGLACVLLPANLVAAPSPVGGLQVAAFDALLAAIALTTALVVADGLAALPALVGFLRAGGWPRIRRRVVWAGAVTASAGGALAGLVLVAGSRSPAQLNASLTYSTSFLGAGAAVAAAIALWAAVATATAKYLTRTPRVRAVQLVLSAVAATMVIVVLAAFDFWLSATQARLWLAGGLSLLAAAVVDARLGIRRAVRQGRRLRVAASGRR